MTGAITDVPGVRVGHRARGGTGVTVVLVPTGTIASAELRGGAPATRELALLEPGRTVEHVDAVVFTGGSAFGLAAADGVVDWLAERGRGYPTRAGPVPIVPTAAIYDLVASGGTHPGPDDGRRAADAAEAAPRLATGRVGAGTGATVGKWRGAEHAAAGGLGSASARVGDATVGALAVVNALGDVHDADGTALAGSGAAADAEAFPDPTPFDGPPDPNTTLVVVATDARCSKGDCWLLAQSAQHGIARAVHPSHTRHDGDLTIALATGTVDAHLDRLRVATTEVVATAVRDAVTGSDDGSR
jgi:L-aminopeptidase/D-esterase-like protein